MNNRKENAELALSNLNEVIMQIEYAELKTQMQEFSKNLTKEFSNNIKKSSNCVLGFDDIAELADLYTKAITLQNSKEATQEEKEVVFEQCYQLTKNKQARFEQKKSEKDGAFMWIAFFTLAPFMVAWIKIQDYLKKVAETCIGIAELIVGGVIGAGILIGEKIKSIFEPKSPFAANGLTKFSSKIAKAQDEAIEMQPLPESSPKSPR